MTQKQAGWVVAVAAFGVMATLMSAEVSALPTWHDVLLPGFVGKTLGHLGAVVAAFVGGKLIPTEEK